MRLLPHLPQCAVAVAPLQLLTHLVLLSHPCCPALPLLQKSIHQQRRWEQTMTLAFPFGLLRLLSLLSRTQLLLQCLYIERHFDIHSVLLHVTIGNTDDGTVHPSCRPRSDQFGNASFSFVFFFLQFFISLPLFSFSFPSMVQAHFHKYSFQVMPF